MTTLILLIVVVAGAAVAVFSAHIPGVRELTGAAPLAGDDEAQAGDDFAATNAAHLGESVDEWATRTGQQPTRAPRPAPAVVHLPEPRKERS